MVFINDLQDRYDYKTVDHDRRIILRRYDGGGPEGSPLFEIDWHGYAFRFQGKQKSKLVAKSTASSPAKFDFNWLIKAIEVPKGFPETHTSVCMVIHEALTVYGEIYSNDRVNKVDVEFQDGAFARKTHPFHTRLQIFLYRVSKKYGRDRPTNRVEEFELARQAANQGDPEAQYWLGHFYWNGWGSATKQSAVEGFKWYSKSAHLGFADAAQFLKEVPGIFDFSLKFSNMEGYFNCQLAVADFYENGIGVSQNHKEAYFWWSIVAKKDKAGKYTSRLAAVKSFLKPDEISEVEKRVEEWKPVVAPAATPAPIAETKEQK